MLIDADEIARMIPHSGSMCLLDAVLAYDDESIHCVSTRHSREDHPLYLDSALSALHACEYAAQAVAVHGALLARSTSARSTSISLNR